MQGESFSFQKRFTLSTFSLVLKSKQMLICKMELWQPCKKVLKHIKPQEVIRAILALPCSHPPDPMALRFNWLNSHLFLVSLIKRTDRRIE